MSACLVAALAYAGRGWPVFPCLPDRKEPATPHGFIRGQTAERDLLRPPELGPADDEGQVRAMPDHDAARCCHCDGGCRPAAGCSECSMTFELIDAAGRDLAREVESVLRFRASVSITTRRG